MYKTFGKRLFDLTAACAGTIICLPFFLAIPILIKIDSEGPVFFIQARMGQKGRLFRLLKFRTMYVDRERESLHFEPGDRSRITPLGAVLRRYKLDELPQLINVLIGDLSMVGPRPEVPEFETYYCGPFENVLLVKPGITDSASIKYRDEEDLLSKESNPDEFYRQVILPDKLRINLDYIDHGITLKQDMEIMALTILLLFRKRGLADA